MDAIGRRRGSEKQQAKALETQTQMETRSVEIIAELFNTPASAEGAGDDAQRSVDAVVTTYEMNASCVVDVEKVGELFNKVDENTITELLPRPHIPEMVPLSERGRPRKVTPEIEQQLRLLLQAGFSRRQAAAYLHIDPGTITHTMARDQEFAAGVLRAEELGMLQTDLCVIAASRKNWRAAAWLINRRKKHSAPLTEEEKQAKHQERLADLEREHELELRRAAMSYDEDEVLSNGGKVDPYKVPPPEWPVPRTKRKKMEMHRGKS